MSGTNKINRVFILAMMMLMVISTALPIFTGVDVADTIVKGEVEKYARAAGVDLTPTSDSTNSRSFNELEGGAQMPGVALYFLTITNTGSAADVFELTASGTLAGWEVSFHANDTYLTPFADTDNDGSVDMGSMAAGASKELVVWISNPYDATDLTTDSTTVTATSSAADGLVSASSDLSTTCHRSGTTNPDRAGSVYGTADDPSGADADGDLVICYNSNSGESINEIAGPNGNSRTAGMWWANPGATATGVFTDNIAWLYFLDAANGDAGYDTVSLVDSSRRAAVNAGLTTETSQDLSITDGDITQARNVRGTTVYVTVHNDGTRVATNVVAHFYEDDPDAGGTYLGADAITYPETIPAGGAGELEYLWTARRDARATHDIYVVIDPDNGLAEFDETNNKAHNTISTTDTTPPVISGVTATNITMTNATIVWRTNEAANSTVEYGTDINYGNIEYDAAFVTSHSIPLTDLSHGTVYHYRVKSSDSSGNLNVSVDYNLTTEAPPDTTGPVTSLDAAPNPTDGAAAVTLTATIDDTSTGNSAVVAAEYFVDATGPNGTGTNLTWELSVSRLTVAPTAAENFTGTLNVSTWDLGTYTIYVHGKDAAGNWGAFQSVALDVTSTPDTTPPAFAGLASATAGDGYVLLTWDSATDDSSPITYLIYMSMTAGQFDYDMANYTTTELSKSIPDLTNGATYHFVVRARDNASTPNTDDNTVEKSATPTSPVVVGSISGVVKDANGNTIAGVTVNAYTSASNELKGSATTSAVGSYRITGLAPGAYNMEAAKSGYQTAARTGVTVVAGADTPDTDFTLSLEDYVYVKTTTSFIPYTAKVGETRGLTLWFYSNTSGTVAVELYVDDTKVNSTDVAVTSGGLSSATFNYTFTKSGQHTIAMKLETTPTDPTPDNNAYQQTVTVEGAPGKERVKRPFLPDMGFMGVGAALVLALVVLTRRRRTRK